VNIKGDKIGVAAFVLASALALWLVVSADNPAADVKHDYIYGSSDTGKPGGIFDSWNRTIALKDNSAGVDNVRFELELLFETPGKVSGEDTWLLGTDMSVKRPVNFGLVWQKPINGMLFSMSEEELDTYYSSEIRPEPMGLKLPGGWSMSFAPGERLKDTFTRLLQDPRLDTLRRNADDIMSGVAEGLKLELKISF
jgi:hypothetical protein